MPDASLGPRGWLKDPGIRIKIAAVVLGLLIFFIAAYASWSTISSKKEGNDVQAALDKFSAAFLIYEKANPDGRSVSGIFVAEKLLTLDSKDIRDDLGPEYDFTIEILDLSSYSQKYSFTLVNGTAWTLGDPSDGTTVRETQTPCTIVVGTSEVHPAVIHITMGG